MNWIVENKDGFSYEKIVKLRPVEEHYEQPGEKPYIKYSCPLCNMCGVMHRVHPGDTRCPICGVNLLWEVKK